MDPRNQIYSFHLMTYTLHFSGQNKTTKNV